MANQADLYTKTIQINAPAAKVWAALTRPELMKQWMAETEIEISTDWQVGSPILIGGRLYKKRFENKGRVLQFEPEKVLQYSHLSSISRLPDRPESYSLFEFQLTPIGDQTRLTINASNFPTETIYKHLAFYWNAALEVLKRLIEKPGNSNDKKGE
jgi:uncharacterized protein YndB with AHSA1/START domain